jgi:hypothetical protein
MPSKPESSMEPHSLPLLSQDDEEQQRLSLHESYPPTRPAKGLLQNRSSWIVAVFLLLLFIGLLAVPKPGPHNDDDDDGWDDDAPVPDIAEICKQFDFVDLPDDDLTRTADKTLSSEEYKSGSADRLSGAVRIATENFDDMGPVGIDPRWDIFQDFHDYLEHTYPLMSDLFFPFPVLYYLSLY